MENFGILTLIPPIVIIAFALWTKRTFEALLLGAILGFLMTDKLGALTATIYAMSDVLANEAWMFMVMFMLGAFVFLLQASKGSLGFGRIVQRFAKTQKKSLLISWLLGIIVFMDDYLNILTISSSIMETCDRQKIPREMLAYVIDSTGAPVCVLVPLSSWAVYFAGVMEATMGDNMAYGTGMEMYIKSIPFMFYGWTAIIVVPLLILGVVPLMFGMKKAYQRVAEGGKVYSEDSASLNEGLIEGMDNADDSIGDEKLGLRVAAFFVPIAVIIAVTVITSDLLIALMWTLSVMFVMYLPLRIMNFHGFCDTFAKGCAFMIPMNLIIIGALTVKVSMDGIGLPDYVINAVLPYMNVETFPAITFVVVSLLSFVTGSNWGIPAVTFPILIPLALAMGASPILTLAAIVSAGTFGSHACFYSDATVLTSQACRIKNLEHAFTQFPYAVISAGLAVIAFLIAGFVFQ